MKDNKEVKINSANWFEIHTIEDLGQYFIYHVVCRYTGEVKMHIIKK